MLSCHVVCKSGETDNKALTTFFPKCVQGSENNQISRGLTSLICSQKNSWRHATHSIVYAIFALGFYSILV